MTKEDPASTGDRLPSASGNTWSGVVVETLKANGVRLTFDVVQRSYVYRAGRLGHEAGSSGAASRAVARRTAAGVAYKYAIGSDNDIWYVDTYGNVVGKIVF